MCNVFLKRIPRDCWILIWLHRHVLLFIDKSVFFSICSHSIWRRGTSEDFYIFAFKFTNDNRCKHRLSSLMSYFSLFLFQQPFIHMDGEKNIICLHYGLWHSSISFERKAQGPFYGNTFPGSARTIWCHQRNSNEGETSERVAKIVKDAISLLCIVYIDTEQLYEMQIVRHNVFINNRLYIRI